MTRDQERAGLLFAGLCALNGAFVPALAKLTTNRADPFSVAAITTLFAGAAALVALALRGEVASLFQRATRPRLLAIGALGTATAFLLFYSGARRSTAIETALCLQIEPAYSLMAAWLALGHRPTRRRLLAIGAILAGITLAVGGRRLAPSSGIWLLLATPACWQISHLIVLRGLRGITPAVLTGARYVYGGILLSLFWAASGAMATLPPLPDVVSLLPLLALQGLVSTYLGTLLWYQAIIRLDLVRATAIVVPSIPVLSLAVTFVLVGEVPSTEQWIGTALTAGGVLAFATAPHAVPATNGTS